MFRIAALFLVLSALPASAQALRDDLWVTNGTVYATAELNNILYVGGSFDRVGPPMGGLMPVSATTSLPKTAALNVDGQVNAIVYDGAGGWYVGGAFLHVQGQPRSCLARIDGEGNLLPWNPGCSGVVRCMAMSGGTLFVGGTFSQVAGQARSNIAAVDAATGALLAWNPGASSNVYTMQVSTGLLYVGGSFSTIAGAPRAHLASLDVNSGAASAWQPNPDGNIYTLFARYDVLALTTYVYVGGSFSFLGGFYRANLASLDATPGSATYGQATSFNPSPDGTVRALINVGRTLSTTYVGGDFNTIAGQPRQRLAAFNGSTLTSWNPGADNTVMSMTLSGTIMYVGGYFNALGGSVRPHAGAVALSGGLATPWDPQPNAPVNVFAPRDTTVWMGGDFSSLGGVPRDNIAAIDLASGKAIKWNPGANGTVLAIEQNSGVLYVGGAFTTFGGQSRPHAAVIDLNGNVGSWNPAPNDEVSAIAVRNDYPAPTIYLGGKFTQVMSQARNHIAAVTDALPIPSLSNWNPNANDAVSALIFDPASNLVYAAGSFTGFANQYSRQYLAQIDAAGVPTSWIPLPQTKINAIALSGGVLYAGFAGLTTIGGVQRRGVAALSPTSNTALPWNPDVEGAVNTILPSGNKVFLGGAFNVVGGQARWQIAQVDAATGALTSFDAPAWIWPMFFVLGAPIPGVTDFIESGGKLYAAGAFKSILGKPHSAIAGMFESTVDASATPPAGIALRALPNPARAEQAIVFSLPTAGRARIEVLDVAGRLVRVLHDGTLAAGSRRISWDGRASSGARVPAGLYFVRLSSGPVQATSKVLRID